MKIAIGGMIASGKSTLLANLSYEYKDIEVVKDLRAGDFLFDDLLRRTYEGHTEAGILLQIHFMYKHYKLQQEYNGRDTFFDRHIIEHWLFAKHRLTDPVVWRMYNNFFQILMEDVEQPDLYIILDMNWDTFVDRIYSRNRETEITNFKYNKDYFYNLLEDYTKKIVAQCELYNIPYQVVNVDGNSEQETLAIVKKYINNLII